MVVGGVFGCRSSGLEKQLVNRRSVCVGCHRGKEIYENVVRNYSSVSFFSWRRSKDMPLIHCTFVWHGMFAHRAKHSILISRRRYWI